MSQYFHAVYRLITAAVHVTEPSKQSLVATDRDYSIKEEEKADYLLCVTRGQSCSYGALEFIYRHEIVTRHLILYKKIQAF
jgi:hypothetical protein